MMAEEYDYLLLRASKSGDISRDTSSKRYGGIMVGAPERSIEMRSYSGKSHSTFTSGYLRDLSSKEERCSGWDLVVSAQHVH